MSLHSFTLLVTRSSHLPTVLTGVALRAPEFTVRNDYLGDTGAWHITLCGVTKQVVESIMTVIPIHMVEVQHIQP